MDKDTITVEMRREIAARLGMSEQYLYQCLTGRRAMKPEEAVRVERDGESHLTRRHLRPNDWWLIWPELVTDEFPAPTEPESVAP